MVVLHSGYLPPVGAIEAIDQYGGRLTHIDWAIGTASNWDVFVPWDEIVHMDMATPDHDVRRFGERTMRFQQMYHSRQEEVTAT